MIDIVIPVYNGEKYIDKCLGSFISYAPLMNICNVILLDDGSSDSSGEICQIYANHYDNINYVKMEENIGLSEIRNKGIELATSKYIFFSDVDDIIIPQTLVKMYGLAEKHNHDMVVGNWHREKDGKEWFDVVVEYKQVNIEKDVEYATFEEYPSQCWNTVAWSKLFNVEFLRKNNIHFPHEKITYEDTPFAIETFCKANTFGICVDDVYVWKVNPNSITTSEYKVQRAYDRLEIMCRCYYLLKKHSSKRVVNYFLYRLFIFDFMLCLKNLEYYPPEFWTYFKEMISWFMDQTEYKVIMDLPLFHMNIYKLIIEDEEEKVRKIMKECSKIEKEKYYATHREKYYEFRND